MSEYEAELSQAIGMANANHECHPGGDGYILMRESQARGLVERLRRYELAEQAQPTELDQRIGKLQAAMPYIIGALLGVLGLILGQAM